MQTPANHPRKKNTTGLIILMVAPFVALVVTAILQALVHALVSPDGSNPIVFIVNIFSVLVGMASVIGILLIPFWFIKLIKTD